MPFQFNVLGGLSLVRNGQAMAGAATQRKPLLMLAMIERAGSLGISRNKLIGLLAPDSGEERARGVLNQLLHSLRKESGEALTIGVSTLSLDPAVVDCDLRQFERHLAAREWRQAVALYRGPYLDGVSRAEAPEVEAWIEEQRRALALLHRNALLELARADDAATPGGGERWWKSLCVLHPLDASLVEGWIRSLVARGDRSRAVVVARDHQRRVRAEAGLEIEESIRRIMTELGEGASLQGPPSRRRSLTVLGAVGLLAIAGLLGNRLLGPFRNSPYQPPVTEVVRFSNESGIDSLDYLGSLLADRLSLLLDGRGIARPRRLTDSAPAASDLALGGRYHLEGDSLIIEAKARETSSQHQVFTRRLAIGSSPGSGAIDSAVSSLATGLQDQLTIFREEWGIAPSHNPRAVVRFMGVYHETLENMNGCRSYLNQLDSAFAADPSLLQPLILQMQITTWCTTLEGELPDTLRYERVRQRLLAAQSKQDRFVSAFIDFVLHPDTTIRLQAGRIMVAEAPRSEMIRGLLIRSLADHNQYAEALRVYESYPGPRRLTGEFVGFGIGQHAYADALHLAGRYEDELRLAEDRMAPIDTADLWEHAAEIGIRYRALAALHRPVDMAEARKRLCCAMGIRGHDLLTYFDELATHGGSRVVDSIVAGQSCLNLEYQRSAKHQRKVLKQMHEQKDTVWVWHVANAQELLNSAERALHFGCIDDATSGLNDIVRPIPDSVYYMAVWGEAAASEGRTAAADSAVTYLRQTGRMLRSSPGKPIMKWSNWFPNYKIAMILARLGRREQAFAQLAGLVKDGFAIPMELHTDPVWRQYASDPMFRAAIGR